MEVMQPNIVMKGAITTYQYFALQWMLPIIVCKHPARCTSLNSFYTIVLPFVCPNQALSSSGLTEEKLNTGFPQQLLFKYV